jgi:hypothetical protein
LLTLIAYLASEDPFSALVSDFKQTLKYFGNNTTKEVWVQSWVRLVRLHLALVPLHTPSQLRSILETAIVNFPENTLLLALHAANEARFRLDDRVRALMAEPLDEHGGKTERSAVGWLWVVWYECFRWRHGTGTLQNVRSVFQKATGSATGKNCAVLWILWVKLESATYEEEKQKLASRLKEIQGLRRGGRGSSSQDSDRHREKRERERRAGEEVVHAAGDRVKHVYFQGLTRLPWCKEYMMLAFGDLKDVLSEDEKERCVRLLFEKGIRLYCEI